MHTHGSSLSFLSLPPEVRHMIYLMYFRSLSIGRHHYRQKLINQHSLAILRVCRLIYREAQPLALPNVEIKCYGNADVIDLLCKMSSVQVTQLRYLRVWHFAVGFKLFGSHKDSALLGDETTAEENNESNGELSDTRSTGDENSQSIDFEEVLQGRDGSDDGPDGGSDVEDINSTSDDDAAAEGVRHFHLGAVLSLFPGLQLDLLRVHCAVGGGPYTAIHTSHCLKSLLEADGYRRLWMDATSGDGDSWGDILSSETWHDNIITRVRPYLNWQVRLNVPSFFDFAVDELRQDKEWESIQAGRVDLVVVDFEDEDSDDDSDTDSEDTVDILIDRGDADFAVKRDNPRVLRCATFRSSDYSPGHHKKASDALRKLFQENSWETIKAMDGFYDGAEDPDSEGGATYGYGW